MFLMNELKLIGKILKHYRKEKKYTRDDIFRLSKIQGKELSLSTIKRVENFETSANNYNIDAYAHIFNMHYNDDRFLYNKLDLYLSSMLNSIKNGVKLCELKQLHQKIIDFNAKNANYIYLSEISSLMISILDIYLYNKFDFDQKRINLLNSLLDDIDDKKIKIFAYYYLYKTKATFKIGNTQENLDYIDKYTKFNFGDVFHFERIAFFFKDNLLDFYNHNKNIYDKEKSNKQTNKIYLYSVILDLSFCELNLENYVDAKNHIIQALNIENINEYIPQNIYLDTKKRLGIINYCLEQYKDAYANLLEVRENDKTLLALNYSLLFKSAEMVDKTDIILKIIDEDNDIKLATTKTIFGYYKMKYQNETLEKQEKYICTHLNKNDLCSAIYFHLFILELKKLVEQTKHYQLYYTYVNQ